MTVCYRSEIIKVYKRRRKYNLRQNELMKPMTDADEMKKQFEMEKMGRDPSIQFSRFFR